jgi:hypothetical protein
MPHPQVIAQIREVVAAKGLRENLAERIVAYLKQAESSEFPNKDRAEQIDLILGAIPDSTDLPESEEVGL